MVLAAFVLLVLCLLGVSVGCVASTAPEHSRSRQGALALGVSVAWVAGLSLPTGLGWVTPENAFPGVPLVVGALFVGAGAVAFSPVGHRLAHGLPLWFLVGFQGFRLPLEVVLHQWGEQGVVPVQMTWEGSNFDVLTGVAALVLAPFARGSDGNGERAAWVAQLVGVVLLANVLRIVAMSVPGSPLQSFEDPLLLPFMLPHQWIATVCVELALIGHLLLFRRLLGR